DQRSDPGSHRAHRGRSRHRSGSAARAHRHRPRPSLPRPATRQPRRSHRARARNDDLRCAVRRAQGRGTTMTAARAPAKRGLTPLTRRQYAVTTVTRSQPVRTTPFILAAFTFLSFATAAADLDTAKIEQL